MENMTYEQAVKRLSQITELLENGKTPLDESLKLFEEATSLVVFCNGCLDKAEQKIIELSGKEDGANE